jgi:hypothetical protein
VVGAGSGGRNDGEGSQRIEQAANGRPHRGHLCRGEARYRPVGKINAITSMHQQHIGRVVPMQTRSEP